MISSPSPAISSTLLVTVTGKTAFVHEVDALAGLVEDGAEIGADRSHEPLRVPDRLRERLALPHLLCEEAVRGDRLDAEWTDHEREHERGR
jgi:hypothetical protein